MSSCSVDSPDEFADDGDTDPRCSDGDKFFFQIVIGTKRTGLDKFITHRLIRIIYLQQFRAAEKNDEVAVIVK